MLRRVVPGIVCAVVALGASGTLAATASAAAGVSVVGAVGSPATYTPAQLAALPQT